MFGQNIQKLRNHASEMFIEFSACIKKCVLRRGSRTNVDRFTARRAPKAQAPREVRGHAPRAIFSV